MLCFYMVVILIYVELLINFHVQFSLGISDRRTKPLWSDLNLAAVDFYLRFLSVLPYNHT